MLNTPFDADDTINLNALRKNVREALNAGVAGFLVPALAAEVYKLTETERLKMVEAVLEEAADKVTVIAGAGETDLMRSKGLIQKYVSMGCKNILFQIPFDNDTQFKNHFTELAELGPEMIMLQDWNASGYGLSDELILNLFETVGAFRCLKVETVPATLKYSRVLELTGGRLNVSGGWAIGQMIEGLKRGVHAFMPTGMHWIYTEIYKRWISGDEVAATELFQRILPVLAFSNQHLDISIHFFKRLLYRQGIYPTSNVRKPILPFDDIHMQLAEQWIKLVMLEEEKIKSLRKNS